MNYNQQKQLALIIKKVQVVPLALDAILQIAALDASCLRCNLSLVQIAFGASCLGFELSCTQV